MLHYQGTLLNSDGQTIHCPDDGSCDASFDMAFRLYSAPVGGEVLYEQIETNLPIQHGVFNVVLGETNPVPIEVVAIDELYLGISVNEEGEMEPRLRIASSAFALRAETAGSALKADDADTLGGKPPESYLSSEAAEALIDGKGFCEGPCYGDSNVESLLGEQGYTPFSGSYTDLTDTPDLSGYCAAPCYGDAQVEAYLIAEGFVPGAGYSDTDVAEYLASQGFIPGAPYSDAQVQAYLDLMGYVPGPHYNDSKVAAYLEANGYSPGPYFSGDFSDLSNIPDVVSKLGIAPDGSLTFEGQPIIDSDGGWLGPQAGLQGDAGNDGVSVTSATVDAEGKLTIVLSDGTTTVSNSLKGDDSVFSGIDCGDGLLLKKAPSGWNCAQDDTGNSWTLNPAGGLVLSADGAIGLTPCQPNQWLTFDGSTAAWTCADPPQENSLDTIGPVALAAGETLELPGKGAPRALAQAWAIPASGGVVAPISFAETSYACDGCGTGVDGEWTAPPLTSVATLPSGEYNFTNFNLPFGTTLKVTGTTPLIIRATGTVTIQGTIDLNADGPTGGPGGGSSSSNSGFGAGGGGASITWSSQDNVDITTIAGGGAGVKLDAINPNDIGGGGGGAIAIFAPTIQLSGGIQANGGDAAQNGTRGGGGAGGSIWLRGITVNASGTIELSGGKGVNNGEDGLMRIDARELSGVNSYAYPSGDISELPLPLHAWQSANGSLFVRNNRPQSQTIQLSAQ
jgi:hypothetical protein